MGKATTCPHVNARVVEEHCYFYPVAVAADRQDPRAHGGTTCTVECRACGAQRAENHNAGHMESSDWGDDTYASRTAEAARELADLRATVASLRRWAQTACLERARACGGTLSVRVDPDGWLDACSVGGVPPVSLEADVAAALAGTDLLRRATELRCAVRALAVRS